jgi:type II secretory pathway pseudopilin PulG
MQIMKKNGFALIEGTVIVALIALLGIIGIPRFTKDRIADNEAEAQKNLKNISIACENYGKANKGVYPGSLSALTTGEPEYLSTDYTSGARSGYVYTFTPTDTGYTVTAAPTSCGKAGNNIYTITTGGVLTSAPCDKK